MNPAKKKTIVRLVISSLAVFTLLAAFPATLALYHRLSPSAYNKSYYGAFLPLYNKLKKEQGKKIVVLGTSSVAFGLNEPLLEEELAHAGLDYHVVSYGLYGAIGTRLMMETALPYIQEGDIVLLCPEQNQQTLSNYFSALETYRAIESNHEILPFLTDEERKQMMLTLPSFLMEKQRLLRDGGAKGRGIYAMESFDENMRFLPGLRPNNVMDGYWQKSEINLNFDLYEPGFLTYVNEYHRLVKEKKADMYYFFNPMNELALPNDGKEQLSSLYTKLDAAISCPILGNPWDSVFEPNYFFDSDFHLNETGASLRSLRLSSALKTEFDNPKPNLHPNPEAPALPEPSHDEYFGDDKDAKYFLYDEADDGYIVTGVNPSGRTTLVVPTHYQDRPVVALAPRAFSLESDLNNLFIQKNIHSLPDYLFEGNHVLKDVHLQEENPSRMQVGWRLLQDAEQIRIHVPKGSLQNYRLDYFWGHYASVLVEDAI